MMHILSTTISGKVQEKQWHVGQPMPEVESKDIIQLQADGHELEHVYFNLPRLRFGEKPVKCWSGTTARTIFAVLKFLG